MKAKRIGLSIWVDMAILLAFIGAYTKLRLLLNTMVMNIPESRQNI
ncbi:hypothetical protein [Muriicola sp. Z0-33]|nr:hypothetical protein [Muriicola sp. Z0-33]MCW5515698.1 hypothetical protein [Muriicola sp. Z0-33]